MTQWVTIFDAAAQPFRWGNAGEGLAALALVALGASASMALRRRGIRGGTTILAVAAGLAVYFAVRTIDHRRRHQDCVEAARRGDGRVLEGVITDYRPLHSIWQRPPYESFLVAGVTVRYPLLAEGCGFHRSLVAAGQIHEGMRVRLLEWNGAILRFEVEPGALIVPPHHHRPL